MQILRVSGGTAATLVGTVAQPTTFTHEWRVVTDVAGSLSERKMPYDASVVAASLSRAIYDSSRIDSAIRTAGGSGRQDFERGRSRGVGFLLDGHAFVAFRGTEPGSWEDWKTDVKAWPVGKPRCHRGFVETWLRVAADVRRWLLALSGSPRVVLTGHSLGGAVATLAAFELSNHMDVAAVITFGAPRVGLAGFRHAYRQRMAGPTSQRQLVDVTWRFVHRGDLFASLAPPPFRHVCDSICVTRPKNTLLRMGGEMTTADSSLERLGHMASVVIGAPPPVETVPTSASIDPRHVADTTTYVIAYLASLTIGPLAWLAAALVRTVALSAFDHPQQFYVNALPWRTRKEWVMAPATTSAPAATGGAGASVPKPVRPTENRGH